MHRLTIIISRQPPTCGKYTDTTWPKSLKYFSSFTYYGLLHIIFVLFSLFIIYYSYNFNMGDYYCSCLLSDKRRATCPYPTEYLEHPFPFPGVMKRDKEQRSMELGFSE